MTFELFESAARHIAAAAGQKQNRQHQYNEAHVATNYTNLGENEATYMHFIAHMPIDCTVRLYFVQQQQRQQKSGVTVCRPDWSHYGGLLIYQFYQKHLK